MKILLKRSKTPTNNTGGDIKEFCVRWDYEGWRRTNHFNYNQKDWNETLITKINQLSAQIYKSTLRDGGDKITIPKKLQSIIEDLEYYRESVVYDSHNFIPITSRTLAAKYSISYSDDDDNNDTIIKITSDNHNAVGIIIVYSPPTLPTQKTSENKNRRLLLLSLNNGR